MTVLLHLPPGRVHRVAHVFAHRAKHREVRGVGQVFLNEQDGDIEGKAREGDARLRVEVPLSLARARLDAARRFGDHRGSCRVQRACRCSFRARDLMVLRKRSRVVFVEQPGNQTCITVVQSRTLVRRGAGVRGRVRSNVDAQQRLKRLDSAILADPCRGARLRSTPHAPSNSRARGRLSSSH